MVAYRVLTKQSVGLVGHSGMNEEQREIRNAHREQAAVTIAMLAIILFGYGMIFLKMLE